MPTFISMINYTEQGVKDIPNLAERVAAAKAAFKAMGGEIKSYYLTLGRYDAIVVAELPNAEAVTKLALAIGRLGNIRTETMQAFPENEAFKLISEMP